MLNQIIRGGRFVSFPFPALVVFVLSMPIEIASLKPFLDHHLHAHNGGRIVEHHQDG